MRADRGISTIAVFGEVLAQSVDDDQNNVEGFPVG